MVVRVERQTPKGPEGRIIRVLERALQRIVGRYESDGRVGGHVVPFDRRVLHELFVPAGLPVPVREDAPKVAEEKEDPKGWRIVRTEEAVFAAQPRATHFRYPYVYGPYQLVPREWCIVRRVLDGRRVIVLPEDGLTLHHFGYAENLAHHFRAIIASEVSCSLGTGSSRDRGEASPSF